LFPNLSTDAQRRAYLALTDAWQPARVIAYNAGIPTKGAGTVCWPFSSGDSPSAATVDGRGNGVALSSAAGVRRPAQRASFTACCVRGGATRFRTRKAASRARGPTPQQRHERAAGRPRRAWTRRRLRLEMLREELARARDAGRDFEEVWHAAVRRALAGCYGTERAEWEAAVAATADALRRAYDHAPADSGDLAGVAIAA
jgi:hypothetical protein